MEDPYCLPPRDLIVRGLDDVSRRREDQGQKHKYGNEPLNLIYDLGQQSYHERHGLEPSAVSQEPNSDDELSYRRECLEVSEINRTVVYRVDEIQGAVEVHQEDPN